MYLQIVATFLKEVGKSKVTAAVSLYLPVQNCESMRQALTSSEAHRLVVAHGKLPVSHQGTSTQHDLLTIFLALLERSLLCFCKALDRNNPMQAKRKQQNFWEQVTDDDNERYKSEECMEKRSKIRCGKIWENGFLRVSFLPDRTSM